MEVVLAPLRNCLCWLKVAPPCYLLMKDAPQSDLGRLRLREEVDVQSGDPGVNQTLAGVRKAEGDHGSGLLAVA
jgi:hypothetical protein